MRRRVPSFRYRADFAVIPTTSAEAAGLRLRSAPGAKLEPRPPRSSRVVLFTALCLVVAASSALCVTGMARASERKGEIPIAEPFAGARSQTGDTPLAPARPRPEDNLLAGSPGRAVDDGTMQRIYDEVRTPFKYGVVLKGGPDEIVDCPNVFRYGGRWYMVFVSNQHEVGYQTHLARSDDLLHWERLGTILPFAQRGWDAWQADGGISLYDYHWEGGHTLETHEGKYWLSYIGGAKHGYEPDPLAIGLAWTRTPDATTPWTRLAGNPVLSTTQPETRPFESVTLYKSAIIHDDTRTCGWPFVMFYNGKTKKGNHEAIGMAVSRDLTHWERFGTEPVVDNAPGKPAISGDPQLTKIGDVWVMFYFGFRRKKGVSAFDTFACSRDLVHWTTWAGEPLVKPSEPFDKTFAHKPWVLKHDGVVYHFYCAVGAEGRVIALATSQDLSQPHPDPLAHETHEPPETK